MKMKTKLLCIAICLITFSPEKCGAVSLGITFHYASSGQTDQALLDMVCQMNRNYRESGINTDVNFYINEIRRNICANCTTKSQYLNNSPKNRDNINVYLLGYPNAYDRANDVIFLNGIQSNVLTHEVGHLLGLLHPSGNNNPGMPLNCSGCQDPGDPDCCADTQTGTSGYWMNQGATSGVWTICQKNKMQSCIAGRPWNLPALNTGALHAGPYSHQIPYDILTVPSGTPPPHNAPMTWSYPSSSCPNNILPDFVEMEVITQCPPSSPDHSYITTTNSITVPHSIDVSRGVKEIRFTYHYPTTTQVNTFIRYYNILGWNFCTSPHPNSKPGKSTNVNNVFNDDLYFNVTSFGGQLNITNKGYNKIIIYNLNGVAVGKEQLVGGNNIIDVSSLPKGYYIIKAHGSKSCVTRKFIK